MIEKFNKFFIGALGMFIAIFIIFGGVFSAKANTIGNIQLISPNGGEQWKTGKQYSISWNATSDIKKFKITLLWNEADGSPSSREIRTIDFADTSNITNTFENIGFGYLVGPENVSAESYWIIPANQSLRSNYRIQISDASKQMVTQSGVDYDVSDNYFSIVQGIPTPTPIPTPVPTIKVVSPNGGEQWLFGKTVNITWERNSMPSQANGLVSVSIRKGDGVAVPVAQNIADTGSYNFTVLSSAFIKGNDYKVIVTSNGYGTNLSDESDGYFSITEGAIASLTLQERINKVFDYYKEKSVSGFAVDWIYIHSTIDTVIHNNGISDIATPVPNTDIINVGNIIELPLRKIYPNESIAVLTLQERINKVFEHFKNKAAAGVNVNWTYIHGNIDAIIHNYGISDIATPVPNTDIINVGNIIELPLRKIYPDDSATSCIVPNGTLIKLPNDPRIYIIAECKKYWIQTAQEFNQYGYKWSDINELPPDTITSIPDTGAVKPKFNIPEGAMIQAVGDSDVYIVKYAGGKAYKRLILSPSVFKSYGHLKWGDIIKVDKSTLDSFTTSNLVKSVKSGRVYSLSANGDSGVRRFIKEIAILQRLGFDSFSIYEINGVDENSYNQGQDLE